jgi:SAM-dependent methyltransferase
MTDAISKSIKTLHRAHYAHETSYYAQAPLREVEEHLLAAVQKTESILDVGCGSGRVVGAAHGRGFDIQGVDLVDECVAAAKAKFPGIRVTSGDMCSLPFPSGSFKHVWCLRFAFNALATAVERRRAISEMARVCSDEGSILIESFNRLFPGRFGLMWVANTLHELSETLRVAAGSRSPRMPKGTFVYIPTKGDGAAPGIAHLPRATELCKLTTKELPRRKVEIYCETRGHHLAPTSWKLFRYSFWIVVTPK